MHAVTANGANIPSIGLGTWTLEGERASEAVAVALEAGYRHIDTAAMYANEAAVGEGLRASGLARSEVFLTSKIWHTNLADGALQRSVETSLGQLGVDALDLALVHWPSRHVPLAETMRALNAVADCGMARHIGVSNFPVRLIEQAVAASRRPLACNQVEYHPFLAQDAVLGACRRHGMALVSYCPLSRGSDIAAEPAIADAARRLGRTPAQVVLRWHVQQDGVAAIPRSADPAHIRDNLAVYDFALEEAEMAAISALGKRNARICDFDFSPKWD